MRAVVFDEIGGPLRVTEVPRPPCPPDAAVVQVVATGVCRSDWHAWRGHDEVRLPHTPGHEFAGVIVRLGAAVTGFTVGDRVTAPFVNGCGQCSWCRSGQAQVCPQQYQPGFSYAGSYAEEVLVMAADTNLVRVPETVDLVAAAALGCRFATAYHGLVSQAGLRAGESLAVIGCGGLGLSAVMIAASIGGHVLAVDPSPLARARAIELGASLAVVPQDLAAAAAELDGGGVHVGVDAFGSAETAAASVMALRRRGRHVQLGLMLGEASTASLPWGQVVSRELIVVGGHGMAAAEYPQMLAEVESGRLRPELLIEKVIGFEDLSWALPAMDDPSAGAGGLVVAQVIAAS